MLTLIQMGDRDQLTQIDQEIKEAAKDGEYAEVANKRKEREALTDDMESFGMKFRFAYGIVLAALVAVVIIGGIKRIGAAAEKVVPTMCMIYMAACLYIIVTHIPEIPSLIGLAIIVGFLPALSAYRTDVARALQSSP